MALFEEDICCHMICFLFACYQGLFSFFMHPILQENWNAKQKCTHFLKEASEAKHLSTTLEEKNDKKKEVEGKRKQIHIEDLTTISNEKKNKKTPKSTELDGVIFRDNKTRAKRGSNWTENLSTISGKTG